MQKLFAAIAAILEALGKGLEWGWDLTKATLRFPADILGLTPPPYFAPSSTKSDIVEDFVHARASHAAVHTLDRDGIETLLEYCRAHKDDRPAMKLPKDAPPAVIGALVSMDDASLRKLSTAGIGQVRKFLSGKPHGIPGVPSIAENVVPTVATEAPPTGMTEHERMIWKIRAKFLKEKQEPFRAPAPR